MLNPQQTLNCAGTILSLQSPIVMGIINVTPDSFYGNSRYAEISEIVAQAGKMLDEGARILDIGGMSTRPGAETVSVEEELKRVIPAITTIKKEFPNAIISIDTVHSEVARKSAEAGAGIINDISAGRIDENMYQTVADLGLPYILMHMQGTPKDMQLNPSYDNINLEVLDFLIAEVGKLRELGVKDIILDPGFGFGKSVDDNYKLLKELHIFNIADLPVLAGLSRKSMINKVLKTSPKDALNGTTALNMYALQQGAKILRCHDVREAVEVIRLWEKIRTV